MNIVERTTDMRPSYCPVCGALFEAATSFQGCVPTVGDISICFSCGVVNVFDDDMRPRRPTIDEMMTLRDNAQWQNILQLTTAIKKWRKTHPYRGNRKAG